MFTSVVCIVVDYDIHQFRGSMTGELPRKARGHVVDTGMKRSEVEAENLLVQVEACNNNECNDGG